MSLDTPPVRLCCGQPHYGAVCPDGKAQCCVCFSRFSVEDLFVDADGDRWDVCTGCEELNARTREKWRKEMEEN